MRDPDLNSAPLAREVTAPLLGRPTGKARAATGHARPHLPALRVLMGLVDEGQAGGVFAAERSMMRGLESIGGVEAVSFMFGSRSGYAPFASRLFRLFVDLVEFARLLRRERPDLVHLNSAYNRNALGRDVLYLLVATACGCPVFLKFHGSDARVLAEGGGIWRWLTRLVVRMSARVGLLSTEELKNFIAAGCRAERFAVVKNAVEADRFRVEPHRNGRGGLLFIARFIPAKGLADLLDAVAVLRQRGMHVPLVCVGDGPQMADARQRARLLGLGDAVAFTGQIPEDDTVNRYRAASILVLPTYHQEGFPMTILHGMAAGMAVVTTRIRAAADHLREPENCLWVQPRNPVSIADALERLLRNPRECARMGRENARRARDFAGDTVAREYRDLYRSILTERRR